MNRSSSQHCTSSIISYASAPCSWVVVQCTGLAPFPRWSFDTIFRIGNWAIPWQGIRSSVARFLSHCVYQLSVYLAPGADIGACLPTDFQVQNYSLYPIQAPNPHTHQHQPPPHSTKTISRVSILPTVPAKEYKSGFLRRTSLGSSLTASFVLLDSSFSRVERGVDIFSVFRLISSDPTSVIEIPDPYLPPKSCCCHRQNQQKARRVFSSDFLSQAIKMASSSKLPEPLVRKYQDPIEELYALVDKYDEARKRQRLVSTSQDTDVLQANDAYQTTNTSKAHGKCCFLSFSS